MSSQLLISLALLLVVSGLVLLLFVERRRRNFGALSSRAIYEDTAQRPGTTLFARSLPLCGKPDYLLKHGNRIIPVEVKTGRTPTTPYANHRAQLFAYCLLVEETYGTRPTHGIIKYPQQEFTVAYTREDERMVRSIVSEIVGYKSTERDLSPGTGNRHLCRECQLELS